MSLTRRKDPVTYIPLTDAIKTYNLDAARIQQAIDDGQIETARLPDNTILLLDESLRNWLADRVSRDRFKHLEGHPISITEAAKKFSLCKLCREFLGFLFV